MTMDISKVPELVDNAGYELMVQSYMAQSPMYPELCDVRPLTADMLYGTKGSVLTGMGRFQEREDGAMVEADEFREAHTWYLKVRQYSRSIPLPKRMVDSADAVGRITNLVQELTRSWGENAPLQKDDYIADMFQQGTLTAGNANFFDGSFPNNADPNRAFIYDGLPWFDTAHTQIVGGNTFANHVVSAALTVASLQTALIRRSNTNAFNDRNERVVVPSDTLLVPAGLEYTGRTILESTQLPGTGNNDVNTVRGALNLKVWRALDDAASASSWWVGAAGKGIRVLDSGIPTLDTVWDGKTKTWHVVVEYHFGAAVTDWRFWDCMNKAAS